MLLSIHLTDSNSFTTLSSRSSSNAWDPRSQKPRHRPVKNRVPVHDLQIFLCSSFTCLLHCALLWHLNEEERERKELEIEEKGRKMRKENSGKSWGKGKQRLSVSDVASHGMLWRMRCWTPKDDAQSQGITDCLGHSFFQRIMYTVYQYS